MLCLGIRNTSTYAHSRAYLLFKLNHYCPLFISHGYDADMSNNRSVCECDIGRLLKLWAFTFAIFIQIFELYLFTLRLLVGLVLFCWVLCSQVCLWLCECLYVSDVCCFSDVCKWPISVIREQTCMPTFIKATSSCALHACITKSTAFAGKSLIGLDQNHQIKFGNWINKLWMLFRVSKIILSNKPTLYIWS